MMAESSGIRSVSDRKRETKRFRAEWRRQVNEAMEAKGLSRAKLADAAGVTLGALTSWLSAEADVEPDVRALPDLARALDRSPEWLMQVLNWLPAEIAAASLRLEAARQTSEVLQQAQRLAEEARSVEHASGTALVTGTALEYLDDYQLRIRPVLRGSRYSVRYADHLYFVPNIPLGGSSTEPADKFDEIYGAGNGEVGRVIAAAYAGRRDGRDVRNDQPDVVADRDDLPVAISVPKFLAPRARATNYWRGTEGPICIVGLPLSGAPDASVIVASALGWASTAVAYRAHDLVSPAADRSNPAWLRMQEVVAGDLLDARGESLVWCYNSPAAIEPTLVTRASRHGDMPSLVYVRLPERLLRGSAKRHKHEEQLYWSIQAQVEKVVLPIMDANNRLVLEMPDRDLCETTRADETLMFDDWAELGLTTIAWLRRHHSGKSFAQIRQEGSVAARFLDVYMRLHDLDLEDEGNPSYSDQEERLIDHMLGRFAVDV